MMAIWVMDLAVLSIDQITRTTSEQASHSPNLPASPIGIPLSTADLMRTRSTYPEYLQWNRILNPQLSDIKADTLTTDHRGLFGGQVSAKNLPRCLEKGTLYCSGKLHILRNSLHQDMP
ncbi:hypothetical protein AVEN_134685-1 [Araneus ventricosus]|uniref:Uncharacterized protein n=1 Tax=Araneus ventricosus TaxID=182803 RepID=A0A4Y2LMD0_ARAVE|nr:hypothetical protein AVEN_134685-1 [Araneus ventricosus]